MIIPIIEIVVTCQKMNVFAVNVFRFTKYSEESRGIENHLVTKGVWFDKKKAKEEGKKIATSFRDNETVLVLKLTDFLCHNNWEDHPIVIYYQIEELSILDQPQNIIL